MESGIQLYTDQRNIERIAHHNRDVASGIKAGELQFNHAFLDTERACNLSCRGCFKHLDRDRSKVGLSYTEMTTVVDFASERGARVIVVAGAGEPMLDSSFKRMIEYVNKKDMASVVFTNGTMLDEETSNFMFDHHVSPILKRTAIGYEKQDYLAGVGGAGKMMQTGMETLLKVRKERKRRSRPVSDVGMECFMSRENLDDIGHVLRLCRDRNIIPYIETFVTSDQDKHTAELAPTPGQVNHIFEELAKTDREEYGIHTALKPGSRVYGGQPCIKAYAGVAVFADGSVFECITGKHMFGSIKEHTLDDIFDIKNPTVMNFYSMRCCGCQCSLRYDPTQAAATLL